MRTIAREIVGIFIFSSDGKLLLGRHDPNGGGVYLGQWICPGGGIEPDESAEQAVIREAMEETCIDVRPYSLSMTDDTMSGTSEKTLADTDERVLVQMKFYDYEIHIDTPAAMIGEQTTEELTELQWFATDQLRAVDLSPPTRAYLTKRGYIHAN